jgi:macrodomain Ter protein organizer (MatP/YcbG family)
MSTLAQFICSESVLQVVDDALSSATETRKKTSNDADVKFKKAIDALSAYEKKYHLKETVTQTMEEAEGKDKSSSTILKRLKETFRVREDLAP